MRKKLLLRGVLGLAALGAAGFAAWLLSLPPQRPAADMPPLSTAETQATLAALAPPKRTRPLVAIVGINDATETTDFLVPYGILRRADVADVLVLATAPGPVTLFPALRVEPQATTAAFDQQHPDGADYVIVPAMSRDDDPAALEWIRRQAGKGATVIGICAGAKVVGQTGLLDGKPATTHWYYLNQLRKRSPGATYVADRRFVAAPGVVTTTGISASMPAMLTLIEAIAGRERAQAVAAGLGLTRWDARHDSGAFQLTQPFATTAMRNRLAFWNRDELGIELVPGVDEVTLALTADAWSRTYRSRAFTFAGSDAPVVTRNGLRLLPDRVAADWPAAQRLNVDAAQPPAHALRQALQTIEGRYGAPTADMVAMQLEYPRRPTP